MCISINRSCVSNYFRYHWYTHKYVYFANIPVCIHTCVSLSIEAVYLIILDIVGTHANMYTIPINMCVYIHVYLYQ